MTTLQSITAAGFFLLWMPTLGCQSPNLSASALPPELLAPSGAGRQQMRLRGMALAGGASTAIGPADLLEVTVVTGRADDDADPHSMRVGDNGAVEVPYVGAVAVAGLDPTEAAGRIGQAAVQRGIYRQPQVHVRIEEQATYRVTVLGAVSDPGVQEVPRRGCDILTAVAAAGGFTEDAGAVVEVLRHGNAAAGAYADSEATPEEGVQQVSFEAPNSIRAAVPQSETFDLARLDQVPATAQNLGDRDVVVVRPREKRVVHVTGLVAKPDQFELTQDHDLRLLDAIALAGGTTSPVADKVILIRHSPQHDGPVVVEVSISQAKKKGAENLVLQSGDMLSVESTVATTVVDTFSTLFRVSVGLGGNLSLF